MIESLVSSLMLAVTEGSLGKVSGFGLKGLAECLWLFNVTVLGGIGIVKGVV